MPSFTLTELGNKSGEIVEAAFRGPVDITSRGKRKFVLLTADKFDKLKSGAITQRAYHADDLSAAERDNFLTGLDQIAASESGKND
jgi:antitoxin Phd